MWWIDVYLEIFALNELVLTVTCSSRGQTGMSTEKPQFDQQNSGEGDVWWKGLLDVELLS